MSRKGLLVAFAFVAAGLSGCASQAKVIHSDQTTAVIAIPDDSNSWPFYYQDAALEKAKESISEPFLVATTRVKVGETTMSSQDVTRQDLGGANKPKVGEVVTANSRTSTSDAYEYHLEFQSRKPRQVSMTKPGDVVPSPLSGGPIATAGGTVPAPVNIPQFTPSVALPSTRTESLPANPSRSELMPATDIRMPAAPTTSLPSSSIMVPGAPGSGR